jgi:hypothetical protein
MTRDSLGAWLREQVDQRTVTGFLGLALLVGGVAILSTAAALITAGVFFLALAIVPPMLRLLLGRVPE